MKTRIVVVLLLLAIACIFVTNALAQTVGLHLVSYHDPNPDHTANNVNPGAYVRFENGITAGFYKNSFNRESFYAGYTTPEWHRISVTAGLISGYRQDPMPLLIPSVRLFAMGPLNTRMAYIPRVEEKGMSVLHFMIERSF